VCDGARVLLIADGAAALLHEPAGPVALAHRPAAVALRLGDTGPAQVSSVRVHADVAPTLAARLVAADLDDLGARHRHPRARPRRARAGTARRPHGRRRTARHRRVWWELAGAIGSGAGSGAIGSGLGAGLTVLADYDPLLGYACVCAVAAR
jgi:hypothetical protein